MVSTVEPLALGEEAREDVRAVREPRGIREDGDMAMESPSKRIRLSSAEEEGGPCDSQDGAVLSAAVEVNGEAGPSGVVPASSGPGVQPEVRAMHLANSQQIVDLWVIF